MGGRLDPEVLARMAANANAEPIDLDNASVHDDDAVMCDDDVEYSPPSPARETATGGAVGGWGHAR